jgi:hypothetical protein
MPEAETSAELARLAGRTHRWLPLEKDRREEAGNGVLRS